MNKILEEFTRLAEENNAWWQDDPRDFIKRFLDGEDQLLPSQLSEFGRAWGKSDPDDKVQAKELLSKLLSTIPPREPGELIFIMGYLNSERDTSHVTLLGPAVFSSEESLQNFVAFVKETVSVGKLDIKLGEPCELKAGRRGFKVESSTIRNLHEQLLNAAKIYGAFLPEEHYTGDTYLPHVTDHDYGLEFGDEFSVERLSISLHPGARVNTANAYEIANLRLR